MDFGIFGFSPEQAQEFRNFMANQHLHQNHGAGAFGGVRADASASATTGGAGANATDGQQSGQNSQPTSGDFGGAQGGGDQQEPVLMHNASHNGVVCDVCNTEIRGFRYKCMQCPDYDLCAKCEHKGNHAGHIMMRIAFPEQSRSAIRRFMQNPSPPETPPHLGHHGHGHGHHGHHRGPHGPHAFGEHPFFAFGGPFGGRRGGCHRRGRGGERGDTSNDEEGGNATAGERPATAPGCPYNMGKKELKRWTKWMKRAASHQHRSAEAYARAAAASGTNATPGAPGAGGAEAGPTECPLPMDFAAVASQIQEFLNYWGVPVDVVELYDQFGNRGQPAASGAEGSAQANQGQATGQQQQNAATGTTNNAAAGTTTEATANAETTQQNLDQQPASPASNLSENMEQMRLGGNAGEQQEQQRQQESLLMDLDENSGWTIVGNSREQSPTTNAAPVTTTQQQPSAPQGSMDSQNGNQPQVTSPASTPNSGSSMPFASAGSNNSMNGNGIPVAATTAASATTPTAPPAFPAGLPNVPLYPVLNQPQIQQILQGVSTAVGNVVRNIPIVTDPRGPMGATTTTPANPQAPRPATGQPETGSMELDARSMKTLNQLLAMGFSNEGGYLTRLVVAKKGDLEAVLSSLFPN